MGILSGSTVYLAGAVEAADNPHNWRHTISTRLRNLNITPWNPLIKPWWFSDITVEEQRSWKDLIRNYHSDKQHPDSVDKILSTNAKLREFCLHLASGANFIIVKLDKTPTIGTFFELSLCKYKPVFVISDDPAISTWLIAELGTTRYEYTDYFHKDIDSVMSYLSNIDNGKLEPYNLMKWSFITYRM
jgi:hypothetical protein